MGEYIENENFIVKEDGTIVRGKKCPKCGRVRFSEGDRCEYCRAKNNGDVDSLPKKQNKSVFWVVLMVINAIIIVSLISINMTTGDSESYEWVEEPIDTVVEEPISETEELTEEGTLSSAWDLEEESYWGEEDQDQNQDDAESDYYDDEIEYE